MKIIYILFIAAADFLLYLSLNKTEKVSSKLLWSSWIIFLFIVVLHTGLIKLDFLLPPDRFIMMIQFLVELIVFHFVGRYYIRKTQKSTTLSPNIADFAAKMASFIFLKAIYIVVFIVQCMFILMQSQ